MKFLIVSTQDSQSGADDYKDLKMKDFKSAAQAVMYVKKEYGEKTELFKLHKIKINFREGEANESNS